MNKKRLLVMGDLHSGSMFGLTPKEWHFNEANEYYPIQNEFWNWFKNTTDKLKPFDIVVHNGDAVQGSSKKKDNIDLLTNDLKLQTDIAISILESLNAKKYHFIYGTGYHVVDSMKTEEIISEYFDTKIKGSMYIDIFGKLFHFKHHASKTSIPHGQGTLLAKKMLWTVLKDLLSNKRKADYFIRNHIHEYVQIDTPLGFGVTCPALQLPYANYGLQFDTWYDVGFLVFDIYEDGKVDFQKYFYSYPKSEDSIIYD